MILNLSKLKHNVLVRDTFIYTLTETFGKAISFIMLPFLSFYLTPDDLGLATNFTVLTNITVLLAGSAMVNALPYFYYEQNKYQRKAFVSNLLILCFAICLLLFLILVFFHSSFIAYLKLDYKTLLLAVPVTFTMLVQYTSVVLCRLEERPKKFALYQISYIVLHVLFMVLFVIILKLGGYGRIYADMIAFFLMFFFHIHRLIKSEYIEFKIKADYLRKLLKFGIPLLPHSLSFWLKGGADKIIITNFCGLYQNGLYSMALTMNSVYSLLSNALMNAYIPNLQKRLSMISEDKLEFEKRKIVRQNYFVVLIFSGVALLAIGGAWIILNYLVDSKYKDSFKFVPLLILGLWIYNLYNLSIQYIYKMKKTFILGIITFTGSLIQVGLTWLFVRNMGVIGVVYSAVVGSILISIGVFIYSNMIYPMPWFYWFNDRNKKTTELQS